LIAQILDDPEAAIDTITSNIDMSIEYIYSLVSALSNKGF
jgi:hypothetical protein